jgi:predicted MFS family arabinose efflux permease
LTSLLHLYKKSFEGLRREVWTLALAMFINRSGSMVLLFTSLYMTRELHFTVGDAGLVMSFYGIGSVLGSYFGGWLSDRIWYRHVIIGSLLISGFVLLLLLWATSPLALSLIIFAYAFTADIFRPANSKAIAVFSDDSNRTRSLSLVRLAVNLGFTVGPAAGGFIALYLGYKWLFIIDAMTGFAAAGLLYAVIPATAREREAPTPSDAKTGSSAYRDRYYLIFVVMVALYGTCFFQIFASIPQYFNQVCHYNEDTIGLLMALNGFLVVLVEMPLVLLMEKFSNTYRFILLGVACLPVCFLFLLLGGQSMLIAIAYTVVITFSEIFAMPFMMNIAITRPVPERQGQYAALYSIAYGIANIAAPVAGLGIAHQYGFDNMFRLLIGMSLLNLIGFYLLGMNKKTGLSPTVGDTKY